MFLGIIFMFSGVFSKMIRIPLKETETQDDFILDDSLQNPGDANYGASYYGMIGLGQPQQKFRIVFDTGFGDLFVPSSLCPTTDNFCNYHNKYYHSSSSTYIRNGRKYSFETALGSGSGFLSTDTLHVVGLRVTNQTFGEITYMKRKHLHLKYDGIFGLAFNGSSTSGIVPPFYNIFNEGLVDDPVYSIYITRVHNMSRGEVIFGGTDPSYYTGNFNFVPILVRTFWTFSVEGIIFNWKSYWEDPCRATIASGSSYILGPKKKVEQMMKDINAFWSPSLQSHVVYCSQLRDLPPLQFKINGQTYTFYPEDYVIQERSKQRTLCIVGIAAKDYVVDPNMWVFGEIFIRKYYTLFDIEKGRIGFASAVPGVNSANRFLAGNHFYILLFLILTVYGKITN